MSDAAGGSAFAEFVLLAADVVGVPARVLDRMRRPVGIQVAGRAGVGRSTVAAALERPGLTDVVDAPAVDVPSRPDPELGPDVVVYVFTGTLRAPDIRALATAPRESTVAVLNKADALGSWEDAVRAAATAAAETGVRTVAASAVADAGALVEAVEHCVLVVRAHRIREALDELAATAARDVDGAIRDGIEGFLRSDPAVIAAAESTSLVGGDGAGDRRRRDIARRRARTRAAVAGAPR